MVKLNLSILSPAAPVTTLAILKSGNRVFVNFTVDVTSFTISPVFIVWSTSYCSVTYSVTSYMAPSGRFVAILVSLSFKLKCATPL